ncbi:MAG: hypothetical protein IKY62_00665 [Clostridia bacterium]|nr:hypothetical protein [Clostridia bacterium]
MYKVYDASVGLPPTLYRTPREIRRDISAIKLKINEINERMNLRTLLMDVLSDERTVREPDFWIPEVTEALRGAKEAHESLMGLERELNELCEELKESKWAFSNCP